MPGVHCIVDLLVGFEDLACKGALDEVKRLYSDHPRHGLTTKFFGRTGAVEVAALGPKTEHHEGLIVFGLRLFRHPLRSSRGPRAASSSRGFLVETIEAVDLPAQRGVLREKILVLRLECAKSIRELAVLVLANIFDQHAESLALGT